jgi:phosphoribosylformylglycinamidine cyclo-ligase
VQKLGRIDAAEMERVFNMGVGMVLVVSPHAADSTQRQLADLGHENWKIGTVTAATADQDRVVLR